MNTTLFGVAVASGVNESIVSALTSIANEATGVISSVAPVAITITGAFLVWKLGIKFFKSITG